MKDKTINQSKHKKDSIVLKVKHMNLFIDKSTFFIYKKATNDLHINENNYHKSIVGTTTIMSFNTAGNITLTT